MWLHLLRFQTHFSYDKWTDHLSLDMNNTTAYQTVSLIMFYLNTQFLSTEKCIQLSSRRLLIRFVAWGLQWKWYSIDSFCYLLWSMTSTQHMYVFNIYSKENYVVSSHFPSTKNKISFFFLLLFEKLMMSLSVNRNKRKNY